MANSLLASGSSSTISAVGMSRSRRMTARDGTGRDVATARCGAELAVLDDDLRLVPSGQAGHQLDLAAIGRELDRVGQQIHQDRTDLVGVDLEATQILRHLDLEADLPGMHEGTDLVDHLPDQVG